MEAAARRYVSGSVRSFRTCVAADDRQDAAPVSGDQLSKGEVALVYQGLEG